jgi:major membrane immunogen (membrane-anchored lipoprotein)
MRKSIVMLTIATIVALLFAGCGQGDVETTTYRAEYSAMDSHGWKPFVEVSVTEAGKITEVDFDYVNPAGDRKSNDDGYNSRMLQITGKTNPEQFTVALEKALVEKQSAPVDVIAGATHSVENFNALAQAALAKVKAGDSSTAVLPMNDTYVVESEPDSRGYIAHLEVTYKNDKITEVSYDEVKKDDDGNINYRKSEDAAYAERWGQNPADVYATYAKALVENQSVSDADVITGATSAYNNFANLVEKVKGLR